MAALRAGCKTIEHGSYLDEEAINFILEKEAILVPTQWVINCFIDKEKPSTLTDAAWKKGVELSRANQQSIRMAIEKNVTIAVGCDIFFSE
eukprot:Awhi_evm1s11651